ncbi:universal stress protein [Halosimplex rubrum]|uniref:Universal stress protein n=1 Tax=Halosimplex rubrum TaxID=869889 RepID=A0A7D5SSG0_9EURY|nr:universal stress protein [Halosimplex rubrum]QLH79607.1 universal stress protein [Halosimplex rubrum]
MTRYLLATASVHTTAAAADYLADRLGADDEVVVLTASEPDLDARDAGDAANVARSRLLPATVDVLERTGDPADEIRTVLAERDADALLLGPRRGDPAASGDGDGPAAGSALGSTVRALLGDVAVPVVVVPVPESSEPA